MAEQKNHAAHSGDPDRLFARPIVEHGIFSGLGKAGQEGLTRLDAEGRARVIEDQLERAASGDKEAKHCAELIMRALTELQAWELIERVRKEVRHG